MTMRGPVLYRLTHCFFLIVYSARIQNAFSKIQLSTILHSVMVRSSLL